MQSLRDSIGTSILLHLFKTRAAAAYFHTFKSKLTMFTINNCWSLRNFNPRRLCDDPYPISNRPRGQMDLDSLAYHRGVIKARGKCAPIWLALKDGNFILLDGAHRICASFLENVGLIPAYVIIIR